MQPASRRPPRHLRLVGGCEQDVDRQVQHHRTGCPGHGLADRKGDQAGYLLDDGDAVRPLRDRRRHRYLVDGALQRVHLGVPQRGRAGEDQHGRPVGVGDRNAGQRVRVARRRRHESDAQPARGAGVAVCGVNRHGFVSSVEQPNSIALQTDEQRIEMASVEPEGAIDSERPKRPRHQLATVNLGRHGAYPPDETPCRDTDPTPQPDLFQISRRYFDGRTSDGHRTLESGGAEFVFSVRSWRHALFVARPLRAPCPAAHEASAMFVVISVLTGRRSGYPVCFQPPSTNRLTPVT